MVSSCDLINIYRVRPHPGHLMNLGEVEAIGGCWLGCGCRRR